MSTSHARLGARLSVEAKRRLKAAAALAGMSLTDFVLQASDRAAERVFRAKGVMHLSRAAQRRFVELLLNPPSVTTALSVAVKKYKAEVGAG